MDREEAARALELLRKVTSQARDDTALENWGVIWMASAVSNGVGFALTHVLFARGHLTPWPYVAVWVCVLTTNAVIIRVARRTSVASGSFIEKQIWSLWTILVVAMALTAVINYLLGLQMLFMPAMACVLFAFVFAAMAPIMGQEWYAPAAFWGVLGVVMALVPRLQFALLGGAWALTQGTAGWLLERRRRRSAQGAA